MNKNKIIPYLFNLILFKNILFFIITRNSVPNKSFIGKIFLMF